MVASVLDQEGARVLSPERIVAAMPAAVRATQTQACLN
jgi:hypothetical protein